jgi:tetratricopeptide (TPR) repeat protein
MPISNVICLFVILSQANEAFEEKLYTKAVNLYSEAVARLPGCALLYGNRAAALMKRGWEGDVYAAIRDCQTALKIDPKHMKAQFRYAIFLLFFIQVYLGLHYGAVQYFKI